MQILWHDLKWLYEGVPLPEPGNMSSHAKQWIRSRHEDAFKFWKSLLDGATVSRIDSGSLGHQEQTCHLENAQLVTAAREISLKATLPHSITSATLSKCAWAFLLARLAKKDDVVFAQNSSGRSYGQGRDILGMCLNHVPVRVKLDPAWKVLDLMNFVQQQHIQSLEYELLDFHQIVERSTA